MTLLCFLLDLRTLNPSLLRDLKQSLLQLANLYAVLSCRMREREPVGEEHQTLPDRIGLCYIHRNRTLLSDELKIAYSPRGNFNLRNFHHSVDNLPTDCFLIESSDYVHAERLDPDVSLARLMNDETLYSWGERDILKKVICVGCSLVSDRESLRRNLMEAAERCISVDFVVFEQDQFHGFSEKLDKFVNSITDMENCIIQTFVPSSSIFCGFVKRWFQDIKNDVEEPIQTILRFKNAIMGTTNQIFCSMSSPCSDILDGLKHCQACRCHGYPITNTAGSMTRRAFFCRVTTRELGACELIENALMVGDQTVLLMPSFQNFSGLNQRITGPIVLNVIERTNLTSLDEGVVMGGSHIVIPSASPEMEMISDEFDTAELNIQAFHGLCRCLFLLDQGLICSSTCNTESMKNVSFQCFYLLQPSNRGTMLLRRLASSEEIWPSPNIISATDVTLPEELVTSIQGSLSKVELRDYNPLRHERGFHQRLNSLVKESLQLGFEFEPIYSWFQPMATRSIPADKPERGPELRARVEGIQSDDNWKERNGAATQDWEELLLSSDAKENRPPVYLLSEPSKSEDPGSSLHRGKPMDEKTSRILERLEAPPRKRTAMGALPTILTSRKSVEPLVPGPSLSQPMKPSFQRLKRGLRRTASDA
ncbi:unnamed protein product [Spirodela intermedia]|uniref:Uncharacterized protein n=1 Tax=Spirodela intermedia TaxID=51605 RepID=A0A7I8IR96_SPIIN|nr:unnamed protein product [Spirodela intermedia]CAA6659693.1 unnamed protein product [Spirodela intermedia]